MDHTDEDSVLRADILMGKIENQQIQVFHRVCQAVTHSESKRSGNGREGVGGQGGGCNLEVRGGTVRVSLRGLHLRLDLKNKMQWAFQASGGCPVTKSRLTLCSSMNCSTPRLLCPSLSSRVCPKHRE